MLCVNGMAGSECIAWAGLSQLMTLPHLLWCALCRARCGCPNPEHVQQHLTEAMQPDGIDLEYVYVQGLSRPQSPIGQNPNSSEKRDRTIASRNTPTHKTSWMGSDNVWAEQMSEHACAQHGGARWDAEQSGGVHSVGDLGRVLSSGRSRPRPRSAHLLAHTHSARAIACSRSTGQTPCHDDGSRPLRPLSAGQWPAKSRDDSWLVPENFGKCSRPSLTNGSAGALSRSAGTGACSNGFKKKGSHSSALRNRPTGHGAVLDTNRPGWVDSAHETKWREHPYSHHLPRAVSAAGAAAATYGEPLNELLRRANQCSAALGSKFRYVLAPCKGKGHRGCGAVADVERRLVTV
jgi:hypothetical protein